jgi:hypothetical protein
MVLGVVLGLGGAGPVQAARIDLVLAVDDTGGMGDDIAALQALLPGVNDLFVDAGHDVAYGLVSFHDTPTVEQDLVGYSVFDAPGGAFRSLTTVSFGSLENGSLAASAAAGLSFRPGSLRVVLLFSDEANQATTAETNAAIADLQAVGAELWALLEDPGTIGSSYAPLVAGSGAYDLMGNPRLFALGGGLTFENAAYATSEYAALVPEPGVGWLLALGAVALGTATRRREAQRMRARTNRT